MANTKYTASELFKLANSLRKTGLTQKEAFAKAKMMLESKVENDNVLFNTLLNKLNNGNIKFTYINDRGQQITTTGTRLNSHIPTNRTIAGRKTARRDGMTVFYDVRHGQYRQFDNTKIVAIK